MLTRLAPEVLATDSGRRADEILRTCVHCGFCNATCPTYALLGNELDGPRGRIYLVKEMLEANEPSATARLHLDRCLTCRACETTCPSGVAYGELVEIGREFVEERSRDTEAERPFAERIQREWLFRVIPNPSALRLWSRLGRAFRRLLPRHLAASVPTPRPREPVVAIESARRVIVLQGCVQQVATPGVNAALAKLLARVNVAVTFAPAEGCCGALPLHLGAGERARSMIAANVDALADAADGAEAIVSTASGCGVTVKDYGRLLANDPLYAARARTVSDITRDVGEYLLEIGFVPRAVAGVRRLAWHAPCTLQHGQRRADAVETLLQRAGYELLPVRDKHLCCGSAGTYSVLQPELASMLEVRKLQALEENAPDVIATANVGCELHLKKRATVPVRHWLELIE